VGRVKRLSRKQLDLLREVLENQSQEGMGTLEHAREGCLGEEERRRLVDLIGDEFARSGVSPDDEPNSRGLELEALLDEINRPLISPPV
jgi:hypothetical protein